MSNGVKAWSYSTWGLYKKCPFAFKLRVVNKIKDDGNYAMQRGTEVHKKAEYYTKGEIKGLPDCLKKLRKEFTELREYGGDEEVDLAVTKRWEPTTWDDWNNVWCRSKVDYVYMDDHENELVIIDYKTGKPYPSHDDQAHIYATAGFAHYDVERIRTEMWYIDEGFVSEPKRFEIDQWKAMKQRWNRAVKPLFTDTVFSKQPDSHCKWCSYAASEGGPCSEG